MIYIGYYAVNTFASLHIRLERNHLQDFMDIGRGNLSPGELFNQSDSAKKRLKKNLRLYKYKKHLRLSWRLKKSLLLYCPAFIFSSSNILKPPGAVAARLPE